MLFATLNVRKPLEMTSHDVIARLRRLYNMKRIGHLGTLDPLAEGVLPVCLGQATKLIEYFPTDKRYTAQVTLGRTTTTLDREGDEVSLTDCTGLDVSPARLESVLTTFRGTIQQQVPLYSAVHVKGKKLYELARQGKTADLPVRETTIHELILRQVEATDGAHPVLTLDVHCSSGTYIRSLARDIGDLLGCGAYLSGLVRTSHGRFALEKSVPLEALMASEKPEQYLEAPAPYLALPTLGLTGSDEARLLNHGMKVTPVTAAGDSVRLKANAFYLVTFEEKPIGVVQAVGGQLKPIKIFHWA